MPSAITGSRTSLGVSALSLASGVSSYLEAYYHGGYVRKWGMR
ncbi:MAG: hypothetical protein ACRD5J_08620 [Nitrososphaeraceae archaeon]